jgi:hypothetical protein
MLYFIMFLKIRPPGGGKIYLTTSLGEYQKWINGYIPTRNVQ